MDAVAIHGIAVVLALGQAVVLPLFFLQVTENHITLTSKLSLTRISSETARQVATGGHSKIFPDVYGYS